MTQITKVTTHISHNEAVIFERSQSGRIGYRLPPLDVEELPLDQIVPPEFQRDDDLEGVPEVSEVDVIRHFIRMSTWNYSIDLGMYPLRSEEHTSELQSRLHLVCRLLLEKKKNLIGALIRAKPATTKTADEAVSPALTQDQSPCTPASSKTRRSFPTSPADLQPSSTNYNN